jgi:hypothetical protein
MNALLLAALISAQPITPVDTLPQAPDFEVQGPSYGKVALATAGGGALAAGATLALAFASQGEQSGYATAYLGLMAIAMYPVGAGFAASRAAGLPTRGPVTVSVLAAGLGIGAWVGIGDGFDDEWGNDLTPWYVGAGVGLGIHFAMTSYYAYRAGQRAAQTDTNRGPRVDVYPASGGGVGLSLTLPVR